jgi:hypothetical protein
LPDWATSGWRRVVDSARSSPQDLVEMDLAERVPGPTHRVIERSVVVLFAAAPGAAGSVSQTRRHAAPR